MSLNYAPSVVTAEQYAEIFERERAVEYPMVNAFEQRMGFAVDRDRLEAAARVLSCPFKEKPPNWQHGRVLYAATRNYVERYWLGVIRGRTLDIGTAKGFSALCVRWAINDAGVDADSYSVDVMPPEARVRRNTPAEVDGLKTLAETLAPFPEAKRITFLKSTGIDWLKAHPERIHFAFVDGKHDGSVVYQEGVLLSMRQQPGDVVIFDDVQIPNVFKAVKKLSAYDVEYLEILPHRKYAIARRV
jgi:hypothetical protein